VGARRLGVYLPRGCFVSGRNNRCRLHAVRNVSAIVRPDGQWLRCLRLVLSLPSFALRPFGALEAFRRAKLKFPGRQIIVESCRWGFTPFTHEEFVELRDQGQLEMDGLTAHRKRFQ
jgi:hypothetical protein